jgi:hypothetical protein
VPCQAASSGSQIPIETANEMHKRNLPMPELPTSTSRKKATRRWLHVSAAVVTTFVSALAATASTSAFAAAPTSPPPVSILTSQRDLGRGDIFITPTGDPTTYAQGSEILDQRGGVVWFHHAGAGLTAADFRTQTYHGKHVLTWWEGTGLGGLASGTDYIYNDRYQQIAAVNAGNGLRADGHEFLITPQDTALILSYSTATADLSSIGGPANQTVIDGTVQEIDIPTGKVLFQWSSEDHVPYSQSEQSLPASPSTPWDWFHINAVHLDTDGNLLIDARNTWTTYKVDRHTGAIIWQLGGKASSFKLQVAPGQVLDNAGELFAWQHDPEAVGDGVYTFFDNEAAGSAQLSYSRAIAVKLDPSDNTATLISSDNQPESLSAPSQGDAQTTASGDRFVGWGSLPYFSEFDASGNLIFNAQLPAGVNSYRAYLLPWNPPGGGPGDGGPGHGPRAQGAGRAG